MTIHKSRPLPFCVFVIFLAAFFAVSPVLTGAAGAAQNKNPAALLLGKPLEKVSEHFDSVRNRPSPQADLSKTFDERDHYKKGAMASLSGGDETSLFVDMRHDIDQETETWHGSAGLQILW